MAHKMVRRITFGLQKNHDRALRRRESGKQFRNRQASAF
jgi:hypothetical protein